jgi:hypothetical protein
LPLIKRLALNSRRSLALTILIVVPALLAACGIQTSVPINQARFSPSFSASKFSGYKGKQINLISFRNSAEKTDGYSYFSYALKTMYSSQQAPLGTYFRSCFRDGFRRAGMRVLEDEAFPLNIPEFGLIITELNDMRFEFRATVTRDGHSVLEKLYAVDMEPYSGSDTARLEKRAYTMVDRAIIAVLADPDFRKIWD